MVRSMYGASTQEIVEDEQRILQIVNMSVVDSFQKRYQPWIDDPFKHGTEDIKQVLERDKLEAQKSVRKQFVQHRENKKLWQKIVADISQQLDAIQQHAIDEIHKKQG